MRIMKCDRCGKPYEFYKNKKLDGCSNYVNAVILGARTSVLGIETNKEKVYDLCEDCLDEFLKFINLKKDDDNVD